MFNFRTSLAVVALLGAVGCGSSSPQNLNPDGGQPDAGMPDSGTPDAGPHLMGKLDVTLSGLGGGAGDVLVTGPNGFSQHLTQTTHLSNLAPGTYAFDAGEGRIPGELVDTLADPTIPTAVTVSANADAGASVEIAYTGRIGTGELWVPTMLGSVGGYAPSVIRGDGGMPEAQVRLDTRLLDGGITDAEGVAFDRAGRMWVFNSNEEPALRGFLPSQLGASSDAGQAITLSSTSVTLDGGDTVNSLSGPAAMIFDAQGNLWVADSQNNAIVKFGKSQLEASGSPVPETLWMGGAVNSPAGLAFDHAGNLWISQCNAGAALMEIAAADLGSATLPAPAVTLTTDGGEAFGCTENIAIDAQDRLWATNCSGFSDIYAVSPANRASSGTLVADVVLSNVHDGGQEAFGCPTGIAFDNQGSAWVSNFQLSSSVSTLSQITAGQLASSGEVQPASWIEVPTLDYGALAFYPAPANVPLYR